MMNHVYKERFPKVGPGARGGLGEGGGVLGRGGCGGLWDSLGGWVLGS